MERIRDDLEANDGGVNSRIYDAKIFITHGSASDDNWSNQDDRISRGSSMRCHGGRLCNGAQELRPEPGNSGRVRIRE